MTRTLTQRIVAIEKVDLFVGIDLGLDNNVAVVVDHRGRRLHRFQFAHDANGYAYLHQQVKQIQERHGYKEILVGMEPTNYYWKLVAAELIRIGIPYRLVNAYTVKKQREGSQLDRAKDDNRDGYTIANLLRQGTYTETQLLTGVYAELRQYATMYYQQRQAITRQKTQMRMAVGQVFPEITTEFKDLLGDTATAMLSYCAVASQVQQQDEATFLVGVRQQFGGRRLMVSKLRHAYKLATESIGLVDGLAWQETIAWHIESLQMHQTRKKQLQARLYETLLTLPEAPYLLSLGLGNVTTALVLAEIGNPQYYRRINQWVKLAGIQPTPNSSGQRSSSNTPMSGKGRAQLRTLLYFACLRLIQTDDELARLYQHLQERTPNGLNKMQALGVLMNKVLRIFWALWHKRTFYDPTAFTFD